jgi:hypothetical protein
MSEASIGRGRCRAIILAAAGIFALALGGCSDLGNVLGMNKNSPDEFAVVRHAALAVPPNFDLRPPEPGAPRPQEVTPRDEARQTLLGQGGGQQRPQAGAPLTAETMPVTPGERALMSAAGADQSPINIREVVRVEGAALGVQDRSFTDNLLFWREPEGADETLDAAVEAERLRREKESGSPTETATGQDGLVIKRKKGGILGDLF